MCSTAEQSGYISYTGVLTILDTTECSSLESRKYPSLSVEIMDAERWQTGWETSVFLLVGVSDLWKSWWNRDRKSDPSGAEEEKWLLDCFRVQTFPYCWDQTGDAGMWEGVCISYAYTSFSAFQCIAWFDCHVKLHQTSLWRVLRCQICPVSWGRCGSTGPSSPRRFATSWRRGEPIRRNVGTASPKPGKEENCCRKLVHSPTNHKPSAVRADFSTEGHLHASSNSNINWRSWNKQWMKIYSVFCGI